MLGPSGLHLSQIAPAFALLPIASALDAADIPRANTPAPGTWPQSNTTGCGFTGLPVSGVLAACTEPLHPDAPDMAGYWRNRATSEIDERVEQCGSRWIDVSKPVVHDFPECTGVIGDGLGCQDYAGPDIIGKGGLCSPIVVACKFERDEEGNRCVNLYAPNPVTGDPAKVVSRCVEPDGSMTWVHPLAGTVRYDRVAADDEPNCVQCVGGSFDGFSTNETDAQLPCPYEERRWTKCDGESATGGEDEKEGEGAPTVSSPSESPSAGDKKETFVAALVFVVCHAVQWLLH